MIGVILNVLLDFLLIVVTGGFLAFTLILHYLPLGDELYKERRASLRRRDLLLLALGFLTGLLKLMVDSQHAVGAQVTPLVSVEALLLLCTVTVLIYCLFCSRRERKKAEKHKQEVQQAAHLLEEQLEEYIRKAVTTTPGTSPVRERY